MPTAEPIRVLVLIKGLGIGGAEKLVADSAPLWDRERFDYRVAYILPWKDQLVPVLDEVHVAVDCIGGARGTDISTPIRLRKLIADWRPSLIHAHLPSAGVLARVATGTPTIYTEHNVVDYYRQPTRILNKLTYRRNAAVIAVSASVAKSIVGYPGPEPVVIPNGVRTVSPGDTTALRNELGIGPDESLVVHVGNIRPYKGHQNLIEATAMLVESHPNTRIVSIGGEKNDGDLERIRQAARFANVDGHLRFLGRKDNAQQFIAAADVFVNPSEIEGLPIVILEALSCGRPVVATDVGGVGSVVKHEQTGLLVPPRDPVALARAIGRALTDPSSAGWGAAGADLVAREHSLESMVREQESLYLRVVNE
ncbi:MAG: glycosyltransferase [Acidimicrobiia bacterium]